MCPCDVGWRLHAEKRIATQAVIKKSLVFMNFACKYFEAFAPQNWFSVCDRSGGYACEAFLWYLQPQTLPDADVRDHDHEGGYGRVHARVSGRDRRQEHVRARVLVFAPEPDQQAAASPSHMILR